MTTKKKEKMQTVTTMSAERERGDLLTLVWCLFDVGVSNSEICLIVLLVLCICSAVQCSAVLLLCFCCCSMLCCCCNALYCPALCSVNNCVVSLTIVLFHCVVFFCFSRVDLRAFVLQKEQQRKEEQQRMKGRQGKK